MTSEIIYFTKEDLEIDKKIALLKEFYLYKIEENKICPKCKTPYWRTKRKNKKNGVKKK